ncbi:hypothetical protein [Parasphingorhabdus sp.]|uniref:hypothetical protein n=1 Tax=Parasphingorhabdus sp. TaxID=2709688 RepID=UPI003A8FE1B8
MRLDNGQGGADTDESTSKDSEEFFEAGNYGFLNERARASEYPTDTNFFDFTRHSLIKGWIDRKFGVIFYFRPDLGISGHGARNYLITFDPSSENFMSRNRSAARNTQFDIKFGDNGRGYRKGAMLVPVIDGLELTKKLSFRQFPAVVGLHTFDYTQNTLWGAKEGRRFHGLKLLTGAAKRELYKLLLPLGFGLCQRKDQMVKRGSKLVGNFSDKQTVMGRKGPDISEAANEPSILVLLKRNGIETIINEFVGNRIEFFASGARPTNLCTNMI